MKKIVYPLLLIAAVGIGAFLGTKGLLSFDTTTHTETQSQVLLENVKTVCKLITVEGSFSDIYSHKDYYWQDVSMFRKKALLKVNAKVGVGYDLSKYTFDMDDATKTIVMKKNTAPEIIYLDTDVNYYDISEGTFNSFKPQELTTLNQKAKQHIRDQAEISSLMQSAEKQGNQVDELIRLIVEQAGWKLEVVEFEGGTIRM